MMRINNFDFENILDRVKAAECLQNAGKADDCEKILSDLANDILGEE